MNSVPDINFMPHTCSACTPMHFLKFMESVKVLALSADEISSVRTDDHRPHTRAEPIAIPGVNNSCGDEFSHGRFPVTIT